MKTALLFALMGLSIVISDAAGADVRSARVSKAIDDLDEVSSVQVVKIVFPTYNPHVPGTVYERVDRADDFDFVISLAGIQKIGNILGAVSPERTVRCGRSASDGYGVLRVEYKDRRVDDYLVSEHYLQSRVTGKCFRQSPWIQRAFALWDQNF